MRVGIVGAGSMGRAHAVGWAGTDADIVGVADADRATGGALAAQYGWRYFDSLDAILPEVDVVDFCLPTHLHYDAVMQAAQAGKHIMCEKPIALTVARGQEMIAACKAAGVRLFIAMVIHFFPEYIAVKRAIDAGQIGSPQMIRLTRASYRPKRPANNWFFDNSKSGGMMLDLMIHDFEYAHWLAGTVERVFAKSITADNPDILEDHALVVLRFQSGAIAHIEGSWAYPVPMFSTSIEVAGDTGLIEYDNTSTMPIVTNLHEADDTSTEVALASSPLAEDPWAVEVRHFWDALKHNKPFDVTPEDALAGLQIALAARRSALSGKPVTLMPLDVEPSEVA